MMKKYFIYAGSLIASFFSLLTTISCSKEEPEINFDNELNKFRDIQSTKSKKEIFDAIGSKKQDDFLTILDLNKIGFNTPSLDKSFFPKYNLAEKWTPSSKYILIKITLEKNKHVSNSKIIQIAPNDIFGVELDKFQDVVSPKTKEEIFEKLIDQEKNTPLNDIYLGWIGYIPPKLDENFKATYNLGTDIHNNFQHINIKITLFKNGKESLSKRIKIEPLDTHTLKKFSSYVKSSKKRIEISKVLGNKSVDDIITFYELFQIGYPMPLDFGSSFFPVFQLQKKWDESSKKARIRVTLTRTLDRKLYSAKDIVIEY